MLNSFLRGRLHRIVPGWPDGQARTVRRPVQHLAYSDQLGWHCADRLCHGKPFDFGKKPRTSANLEQQGDTIPACHSDTMEVVTVPPICVGVHRSHDMSTVGGVIFCNSCVAYAKSTYLVRLSKECKGVVKKYERLRLRALQQGMLPSFMLRWPDGQAGTTGRRPVQHLAYSDQLGWHWAGSPCHAKPFDFGKTPSTSAHQEEQDDETPDCLSDMKEVVTVPPICARVHRSHSLWTVGGMVFCSTCGARGCNKRLRKLGTACSRKLGTRAFSMRRLREGMLATGDRWPDGHGDSHSKRAVRRLIHSDHLGWICLEHGSHADVQHTQMVKRKSGNSNKLRDWTTAMRMAREHHAIQGRFVPLGGPSAEGQQLLATARSFYYDDHPRRHDSLMAN